VASADWSSAAALLQQFASRVPHHVPALMRLVEVSVDGGLEAILRQSQAQLADAYIAAGRASEARFIAEDLVSQEPSESANIERFRRALVLMGEADPDAVIASCLNRQSSSESVDLGTGIDEEKAVTIPVRTLKPPLVVHGGSESVEVDLSIVLDDIKRAPAVAIQAATEPSANLDQVFARLRDEARQSALDAAQEEFRRGLDLYQTGKVDECIPALRAASRAPRLRFATASLLGRIYRERGMTAEAIESFERAAEAPAPSAEEGQRLLYDLAESLESAGEIARALVVFMVLQSEAGDYRDVSARIERLSRVQARG
jgi:tetratricopeptide (TPR) repeat protein